MFVAVIGDSYEELMQKTKKLEKVRKELKILKKKEEGDVEHSKKNSLVIFIKIKYILQISNRVGKFGYFFLLFHRSIITVTFHWLTWSTSWVLI
jgi:hypothetical protein